MPEPQPLRDVLSFGITKDWKYTPCSQHSVLNEDTDVSPLLLEGLVDTMAAGDYLPNHRYGRSHLSDALKAALPSLEVLCADKFENEEIEEEAADRANVKFYRGGQVQWLNFYWAEKKLGSDGTPASPFIKRDAYKKIKDIIQMHKKSTCSVSTVCVAHSPGSGGSTLARHVMWDLRKTLRCAVLEDVMATPKNIAKQTIALFKAGGPKEHNTVLLLVDNVPKMESLHNVLVDAVAEEDLDTNIPVVVILKCQYKLDSSKMTLKAKLSFEEQALFNKKREEIQVRYKDESKKFYAFNIMQQNFSNQSIQDLSSPFFDGLDPKMRSTKLFAVLLLINAYVPGSAILKSECEKFLRHKKPTTEKISFKKSMHPFMDLLVSFSKSEKQVKYVRVVHPLLATPFWAPLKDAGLTHSEILEILLKNISGDNKGLFFDIISQLLVKRRKENSFSDLIETIIMAETETDIETDTETNTETKTKTKVELETKNKTKIEKCVSLLKIACRMLVEDAFIYQVVARILYLKLKKFSEAEKWAKKAINKSPKNSFIADTLGQVHKNHLYIKKNDVCLAQKAIDAFEHESQLAEEEVSANLNDSGKKEKQQNLYNSRWLFGCIQVANNVFFALPEICKPVLKLEKPFESLRGKDLYETLLPHKDFLLSLRNYAERGRKFFEMYLTYSKPKDLHDDPAYLHDEVIDCFVKYAASDFESVKLGTQTSFPGLLHCLCDVQNRYMAETWKNIISHYCATKDMSDPSYVLNYLLANLCLSFVDQTSPPLITYNELENSLHDLFKGSQKTAAPEVFFLLMLIFWPLEQDGAEESPHTGVNIVELVTQLEKSYDAHYERYLHGRYIVPLFFLTQGTEWKRLAPRPRIENLLCGSENSEGANVDDHVHLQWRNDGVWKNTEIQNLLKRVSGKVEKRKVFACCGDFKIPVSPHNKASVRKPGEVTFYLGFSIKGPVAFDVKYDS